MAKISRKTVGHCGKGKTLPDIPPSSSLVVDMFGALYLQCDPANICQYTALVRGRSYVHKLEFYLNISLKYPYQYAAPSTSAPPPYEDPFSYIKKGTSMMIQPSVSKFTSGYIEEEEEERDTDTNTIEFSDPDHDEEVEAAEQEYLRRCRLPCHKCITGSSTK
ncbi:hypothetical protein PVK06_002991 [Gossypium arboreum]|uniref:Uncharacterized protein n=1 Tax=Gossypium arboreum TaxID=29729 RepID=A0ABR0R6A5_GOSAR|nr:hypothetical protein PVK06_002991 [Gossypium arboreum]